MSRGRRRIRIAHSTTENECRRCGRDIEDWGDAMPSPKGGWIHKGCYGGGDE